MIQGPQVKINFRTFCTGSSLGRLCLIIILQSAVHMAYEAAEKARLKRFSFRQLYPVLKSAAHHTLALFCIFASLSSST